MPHVFHVFMFVLTASGSAFVFGSENSGLLKLQNFYQAPVASARLGHRNLQLVPESVSECEKLNETPSLKEDHQESSSHLNRIQLLLHLRWSGAAPDARQVEFRKSGSPSHRSVRIFVASGARDASSPRMASPLGAETQKRTTHPVMKPLQRVSEKIQKVRWRRTKMSYLFWNHDSTKPTHFARQVRLTEASKLQSLHLRQGC